MIHNSKHFPVMFLSFSFAASNWCWHLHRSESSSMLIVREEGMAIITDLGLSSHGRNTFECISNWILSLIFLSAIAEKAYSDSVASSEAACCVWGRRKAPTNPAQSGWRNAGDPFKPQLLYYSVQKSCSYLYIKQLLRTACTKVNRNKKKALTNIEYNSWVKPGLHWNHQASCHHL